MLSAIDEELKEHERVQREQEELKKMRREARLARLKQTKKERSLSFAKGSMEHSVSFATKDSSPSLRFAESEAFGPHSMEQSRHSVSLVGDDSSSEASRPARKKSLRTKSGYRLNVNVDTKAAELDGERKFDRNYSTRRRKSKMITDHETGMVNATKEYDLVPEIEGIIDKQKRLRSLLPAMDHRTDTYRMVMKELAENENILRMRRSELERQKLEANAERVAKKAGMVSVWRKLVQKKEADADLRRQSMWAKSMSESQMISRAQQQQIDDLSTWNSDEIQAAALTATFFSLMSPLPPLQQATQADTNPTPPAATTTAVPEPVEATPAKQPEAEELSTEEKKDLLEGFKSNSRAFKMLGNAQKRKMAQRNENAAANSGAEATNAAPASNEASSADPVVAEP